MTVPTGPQSALQDQLTVHVHPGARSYALRLFLLTQGISATGAWMNQVAIGWLAHTLTGSPAAVGLVMAVRTLPILVLALPAGMLADRFDRTSILIVTSGSAAALYLGLGFVDAGGHVTYVFLLGAALIAGVAQAIEIPALQVYVGQLVRKDEISVAIALNAVVTNSARVLGPAVGGLLIAVAGTSNVFLVNAFSYLPFLAALFFSRSVMSNPPTVGAVSLEALRETLRYVRNEPRLRLLLGLLAVYSVVATGFIILAPTLAAGLGAGPGGAGALLSGVGVGAVIAGVFLARQGNTRSRPRILVASGLLSAAGQIGLALSRDLGLSVICCGIAGAGMVAFSTTCNVAIQSMSPGRLRGRTMSLFVMAGAGLLPFGSLLLGGVAQATSIFMAIGVGALVWLATLVATTRRIRQLRF